MDVSTNWKAIKNSFNGIFVFLNMKSYFLTTLTDAKSIGMLMNSDTTSNETSTELGSSLTFFNLLTRS